MSFGNLQAAEAAETERTAVEEFKAKRARILMTNHNREMNERQAAKTEATAKADAAKKLAKEKQIQKNLQERVRARILSSPSATEADVVRLFDQTRDAV